MKLLIGLGNPGEKFEKNRHNAGRLFVGNLRDLRDVRVLKADCFMNDSGIFVKKISRTYNLEPSNLYIVHDDLDLRLGSYKIDFTKGPKVHNGVNSIEEVLGTKDFWRIRIGVDCRDLNNRIPGDEYVLQDFTNEELEILKGVFDAILKDNYFPR